MRAIAGNAHLLTSQEVHWVVSIRWRSQGGTFALQEWVDLSDRRIPTPRLYDGFGANVQTEPLLKNLSPLQVTGDLRNEAQVVLEVDRTAELVGAPGSTFSDHWSATHPPEYADVFVSCVLGTDSNRTAVLLFAGALEAVEEGEDFVRLHVVDQTRKLFLPLVGRVESDVYQDADSSEVGGSRPLAIGEATDFTGPMIVQQFLTALAEAVSETATSMEVGSTTDLPNSGQVLVDDEVMDYASKTATTLDGLTRGVGASVPAAHQSGTLVFLATGQTIAGQAVDGPVVLLHGKALPAAAVVRAVRAFNAGGLQGSEVPANDYVADLQHADGAKVGMVRSWPQEPDQAAEAAWYAIELDMAGVGNQTPSSGNVLGGASGGPFTETNYALVWNGGRLVVRRDADITIVGRQKIEAAYVLIEYGNLSNPDPVGKSVPNAGVNTRVWWYDSLGASHVLGSLAPEQEPLPEQVYDPSRTVRTRPLEDQHRHTLSGAAGVAGPEAEVLELPPTAYAVTTLPSNGAVLPGTSGRNYDPATVTEVARSGDTSVRLGSQLNTGRADFGFRMTQEDFLRTYAFRRCRDFRYQFGYKKFGSGTGFIVSDLEGGNGVFYGQAGGGVATSLGNDEWKIEGTLGDLEFCRFWPPVLHGYGDNSSSAQSNDQVSYIGALRVALAPDPQVLPATMLYSVPTASGGGASNVNGNKVCNGLAPATDVSTQWTTGRVYFDAPGGTAEVRRVTVCWVGPQNGSLRWKKFSGTTIATFGRGQVVDISSQALTVADLKDTYLEIVSGTGYTWVRLVVEYEGNLTDTDTVTAQRTSSLKAFDITPFIDTADWDSLRNLNGTVQNSVQVGSPDSTGAFNTNERNNDSLWVLRVSLLIKAAAPVTQLARALAVSFRGLYGENGAGLESRAAGDVILALLGADFLNVGGTDYFPTDGWPLRSTFHSDQSGPAYLANGVYRDAQDAVAVVADLADQARHAIYWEGGRLKMQPYRISGWGAAVQTFTDAHLLEPISRPRRGAESILNSVLVEYDRDHVRGGFRSSERRTNSGSQALYGTRRDETLPMTANDKNAVDAGSVQNTQATELADSYLGRFAVPAEAVVFMVPLVGLAVEIGDVVALSTAAYTAAKVEVAAIEFLPGFGALDRVRITGLVRA